MFTSRSPSILHFVARFNSPLVCPLSVLPLSRRLLTTAAKPERRNEVTLTLLGKLQSDTAVSDVSTTSSLNIRPGNASQESPKRGRGRPKKITMPERTYEEALELLGKLQSNAAVRNAISATASPPITGSASLESPKPGPGRPKKDSPAGKTNGNVGTKKDMNLSAIPEMLEWVKRAGYDMDEDFENMKFIHIAGTKGKGSVCAMVASILNEYTKPYVSNTQDEDPELDSEPDSESVESTSTSRGFPEKYYFKGPRKIGRIGTYTSPHLLSVRERIAIDGQPISKSLFTQYFFSLWDRFSASAATSGHPNPTSPETKPMYFRFLTIMALHCFLGEGVQTAVLECGIGGEYDSTNIIPASSTTVTAITRLGIDHVGMLGNSLAEIAWHKSGIMKKGVEIFTIPQEPEASDIMIKRCVEKEAEAMMTLNSKTSIDDGTVKLGLEGDFQKYNANLAVAIAAAHLRKLKVLQIRGELKVRVGNELPRQFKDGLAKVKWRGRCETIKEGNIEWCVDGAHTVDSIEAAGKWFSEKIKKTVPRKIVLVFNQQERDTEALLSALRETVIRNGSGFDHAIFCTNTLSLAQKAQNDTDELGLSVQKAAAATWSRLDASRAEVEVTETIQDAVDHVRKLASETENISVLVTGSLYLVSGFLKILESDGD